MDESKVASRALDLDVEKFAAGQDHSDSGNHNARGALIKHHYHASNWPSKHPRFKHPAYEAYKNVPAEEQNKILEAREHARNPEMEEAAKEREKAQALGRFWRPSRSKRRKPGLCLRRRVHRPAARLNLNPTVPSLSRYHHHHRRRRRHNFCPV
ncbi:hypothetical protein MMYC01_208057 [Madurella mycetomatis]|uniref:Uncharacterized protein n=1 Tax=Madurella mycetomatis TaxID=100816 RepID=A0A175VW72_9PEZI|nr:hypothetical protein MMYC01_208057 [Madurella mycetomatis]